MISLQPTASDTQAREFATKVLNMLSDSLVSVYHDDVTHAVLVEPGLSTSSEYVSYFATIQNRDGMILIVDRKTHETMLQSDPNMDPEDFLIQFFDKLRNECKTD